VGTRHLSVASTDNPPHTSKAEITRFGMTLRVGDRLLQQVNDYDREVFNGDQGILKAINPEEQEVTIQFDQRLVSDYADLNELALAWAVTTTKRKGGIQSNNCTSVYDSLYDALAQSALYRPDCKSS